MLASLKLLSVQPRHASKESKNEIPSTVKPGDHYPLTRTSENGVWILRNLKTCRCLPLPGSEAKSLDLMMFDEGKKSMSMISWSRKGTQANCALFILYFSFYFLLSIVIFRQLITILIYLVQEKNHQQMFQIQAMEAKLLLTQQKRGLSTPCAAVTCKNLTA